MSGELAEIIEEISVSTYIFIGGLITLLVSYKLAERAAKKKLKEQKRTAANIVFKKQEYEEGQSFWENCERPMYGDILEKN